MKKLLYTIPVIIVLLASSGCSGYMKNNSATQFLYGALFSTAPVLSPLQASATETTVTLTQPTFVFVGNPPVTTPGPGVSIDAYIGFDGVITVNNSSGVVSNYIEGPIDVSGSGYTFGSVLPALPLDPEQNYRVIVVATTDAGNSIKQIAVVTGGIAPVLDPLQITSVTNTEIELAEPSQSTVGTDPVYIDAYIGEDGSINVDLITGLVTGTIIDQQDLTPPPVGTWPGGSYTFTGLSVDTVHRIIVVADSPAGFDVRQIVVRTGPDAPVLGTPVISAASTTAITLAPITFTNAGNPVQTTGTAYIGLDGTITVTPLGVVGSAIDTQAVSTGVGYTFGSLVPLTPNTTYRIIVVSSNASGVSIRQIVQNTGPDAPVMAPLVIGAVDDQNITLNQVSYTTAGFPLPVTAQAYLAVDGNITVSPTGVIGGAGPIDGPHNVIAGNYPFTSLTPNTTYRIIVVSSNASGASIRQIVQTTAPSPPVLAPLSVSFFDQTNITLDMATYTSPGFPVPGAADAYIGLNGTITVTPLGVVSFSLAGPIDVDSAPNTFAGLANNTTYRIIVVSSNASGVSIRQIIQTTAL